MVIDARLVMEDTMLITLLGVMRIQEWQDVLLYTKPSATLKMRV